MTDSTALAHRLPVRELVAVFAQAEADVREAFGMLVAAQERIDAAFRLGDRYQDVRIDATRRGHEDRFDDPDHTIDRMRRAAWETVVERLELRRALSIERYDALVKRLREEEHPLPLTEENLARFVSTYATSLPEMWAEACHEVFNWLRPRADSWRMTEYKTNQKNARFELGPRIVLTGEIDVTYGNRGFHVRYDRAQRFLALDNVFSGLDGMGMVAKSHQGPLADAIGAAGPAGKGETAYFAFRCFKNRSLHLTFRRLDLLAKLNAMVGGMRLRPGDDEV